MKPLIAKLKAELNSKPEPGIILNTITDNKLQEISQEYQYDHDALWIGAYLADMFISEGLAAGKIALHIPMAMEYAQKIIKENSIPAYQAEIILEIIETHHGGEQKHIESKLFKNADCFKFLDPKGVFHLFGSFYKGTEDSFKEAIEYVLFKVEEKYSLIDLNDELKAEATELYNNWQAVFAKMEYKLETPEVYK